MGGVQAYSLDEGREDKGAPQRRRDAEVAEEKLWNHRRLTKGGN